MITLQYLEDSPELTHRNEKEIVDRLRAAYERLPFSHLLIGWHIPPHLLESCRVEAERLGIRFLRWHLLLTGDAIFQPKTSWQVVGLTGQKIRGFNNMPEFTFVCPNHPEVRDAILHRMEDLLRDGLYQGFFLDRVRFPSPAVDPINDLGCFCDHCRHKATTHGLDLERLRSIILEHALEEKGRISLVQALLGGRVGYADESLSKWLNNFFEFRKQSIQDFVALVYRTLKVTQLEIGLDCFSPSLSSMVGQDLGSLSKYADWIKVMSYAHTHGPAGLPFELLGLFDYLISTTRLKQIEVLALMSESIGLSLPTTRESLEKNGLSPEVLESEVRRGVESCNVPILAGMELVEIMGVAHLHRNQIKADLAAVGRTGAAGLSISWDLLHIPLDRLNLVRIFYSER
jgi:hypothetical protein